MWACSGLEPSQIGGTKSSSLSGVSLEDSKVPQCLRTFLRSPQVAAAVCHQLQESVAAAGLEEPLAWLFLHEFVPSPSPTAIPSQAVLKKGKHSGEH